MKIVSYFKIEDDEHVAFIFITTESPIVIWGETKSQCCESFSYESSLDDMDKIDIIDDINGQEITSISVGKSDNEEIDQYSFGVTICLKDKQPITVDFTNSQNGYYSHMCGVSCSLVTENVSI